MLLRVLVEWKFRQGLEIVASDEKEAEEESTYEELWVEVAEEPGVSVPLRVRVTLMALGLGLAE